jgi:nitrate reductase NapD
MEKLCISSLVVQAEPARLEQVRSQIETVDGAEVMGEGELGKLVVVLDMDNNRQAADTITDIQKLDGVLSATLIYQYDDYQETHLEDPE